VSEKSVASQQAGLVRRAKMSRRDPADLAGACFGNKFVVSVAGEAYDVRVGGPNWKSWLRRSVLIFTAMWRTARFGRGLNHT